MNVIFACFFILAAGSSEEFPISADELNEVTRELRRCREKQRPKMKVLKAAEDISLDAKTLIVENVGSGNDDLKAIEESLNHLDSELFRSKGTVKIPEKDKTFFSTPVVTPTFDDLLALQQTLPIAAEAVRRAQAAFHEGDLELASNYNNQAKFALTSIPPGLGGSVEDLRRLELRKCSILAASIDYKKAKVTQPSSAQLSAQHCSHLLQETKVTVRNLGDIIKSGDILQSRSNLSMIDHNLGILDVCIKMKLLKKHSLIHVIAEVVKHRSEVNRLGAFLDERGSSYSLIRADDQIVQICSYCSQEKFDVALNKLEVVEQLLAKIATDPSLATQSQMECLSVKAKWLRDHIPIAIKELTTYPEFRSSVFAIVAEAVELMEQGKALEAINPVIEELWKCYSSSIEEIKGRFLCIKLSQTLENLFFSLGFSKRQVLEYHMPADHEYSQRFLNMIEDDATC